MKKSHATKLWLLQIFYASCYIALVVSLIVQVSQCIKKFTDGSTYYDSSVVRQKITLFPDITVCGNMFGLKEAKLKEHGITFHKYRKSSKQTRWTSKLPNVSVQEVWNEVTYKAGELIEKVMVTTWTGEIFSFNHEQGQFLVGDKTKLKNQNARIRIVPLRDKDNGQCYTIKVNGHLRALEIKTITLKWLNSGTVFLHSPDMFFDRSLRKDFAIEVTPKFKEHYYLQAGFTEKESLAGSGDHRPCTAGGQYHYDSECIYKPLQKIVTKNGSCTSLWVLDNSKACTDGTEAARSIILYIKFLRQSSATCLIPCKVLTAVSLSGRSGGQVKAAKDYSYSMADIEFQPWIETAKERALYTSLSLFAEVGGYVGIFVGYSLLNLAESIYNFLSKGYSQSE